MIVIINGFERDLFPREIEAMHRIRGEVFHQRLGWDVTVRDGLEIDRFDDENPAYLVSVDDASGDVRGSLRLLPTTGPNMLRDVFHTILDDGEVVESATIWESSRFSMAAEFAAPQPGRRLSYVTGELLAGIVEVGLASGLTEVVSVFDARMIRIFRAAGCPAELIGKPTRFGACMTYAGLFEISEQALARIRDACGIAGPVLQPAQPARRTAA